MFKKELFKGHKERLESWFEGVKFDYYCLYSKNELSLLFVETNEHDNTPMIELVRIFTIGDRVEISIDYKGIKHDENYIELMANITRVMG